MTKSRNLTNENVIIALSNKTKLERDCKVKSPAASLLRTDTRLTARDPFFLVVRLEVGAIHGSDFWLLLLGGWLPTLPPSYVVLLETPDKGQIVRLDLPEEQHKNNKLFSEYNS